MKRYIMQIGNGDISVIVTERKKEYGKGFN